MKIKHLTLAIALILSAPFSFAQGTTTSSESAPAVPADVLQAAQAALTAGDLKALGAVFEANPKVVLELAASLTDANKSSAPTIAAVAAKAYPGKAAQIASVVAGKALPEQKDAIYSAVNAVVSIGSTQSGNNGEFTSFPKTNVDPSVVSPSS